jgi:hypothetical protein
MTAKWSELVLLLCSHEERFEKDGKAFIAALLRPGKKRGPKMVIEVTALVGDFHLIAFERIRDNLRALGVEFVAFSTFNHSKEYQRYRIFVPLEKSLAPARFRMLWRYMRRELFLGLCEHHMHDICQLYFFPSCGKGAERFSFHNKGRLYEAPLRKVEIKRQLLYRDE